MDNPQTLVTLVTQETGRRQTKHKSITQKAKKFSKTEPTKNRSWTKVLASCNQFLPLIKHPPWISFTSISFPPLRSTIAVISSNGKQVHQKSKTNTQVGHLLTNSCITTVEVVDPNLSRSWSQLIKNLTSAYHFFDIIFHFATKLVQR